MPRAASEIASHGAGKPALMPAASVAPLAKKDAALAPNAGDAADLGITVQSLRLSAASYMLDLRYRVTDPQKAKPFLDRKAKPRLISQKTGAVMYVPSSPKVGAMRQTPGNPDLERIYFVMFANPGRHIQTGDKVTVVVGDCRIEDLVVQ